MIHMNEALIVEGRYDKSKLSAMTDAIIVTNERLWHLQGC